jgi:hydroxymethylbilane synthase
LKKVVIGSRGSRLALWQAEKVRELLEEAHPGLAAEIRIIKTKGDAILDRPLEKIGDKGLFTKELEIELLADRIDIAVHSLKDLPSELPEGLELVGCPARADTRDAFVSRRWKRFDDVGERCVLATGSNRRRALVLERRPHARFEDLRGNIETRLEKLEREGWDGIVMATAALDRLGLSEIVTERLDRDWFVPAVGQGAIGIEGRAGRPEVLEVCAAITDPQTFRAVRAERAFMHRLEGGCMAALGAWGRIEEGKLRLTGFVSSLDGAERIRESTDGSPAEPEAVGIALADRFLERGAGGLLRR